MGNDIQPLLKEFRTNSALLAVSFNKTVLKRGLGSTTILSRGLSNTIFMHYGTGKESKKYRYKKCFFVLTVALKSWTAL